VTDSEIPLLETGVPPGPVLTIAPLPDGEFLAGVGPVGDVDSELEWQLYRGRDGTWQRLFWPSEAIPRALHPVPDLLSDDEMAFTDRVLFAVPFSNALFGRGQAWGLMRSANSGRSWQQTLTGLGDPYVMDLALSPASPNHTIFVVTWYSGVYRSKDAGRKWEAMPLIEEELKPSGGPNPYDLAVAVSPDYQDSAGDGLVIASFSHGLYRWDLSTESWQTIPITVTATIEDFDPPETQLTAGAVVFSPDFADDGTIYLQSGYAGLFRSTDRGETWRHVSRRLPLRPPFVADFHLAVASADEAYVLLDSEETDKVLGQPVRVLFRTHDGGRTWEALQDPPTLGWVSAFILTQDTEGRTILHLGGSRGGVSSHRADDLTWD
jgi:photosystem II stability/assembly factor-like uncharacterized protein